MSDIDRLQAQLCGQDIGGYRIESVLGQGGVGVVFRAVHKTLALQAAIKVLWASDAAAARRCLLEARALAAVQHPSLVRLFDIGELPDGTIYLQMELLEGPTLRALCEQQGGRLPLPLAVELVRQLAAALQQLHQRGIVHRDLSPRNVMVVADPELAAGQRAKLLDFGLARFRDSQRTQSGQPTGTPRYMAPEQWDGVVDLDGRTDVYALGVILFELLTGEQPYSVPSDEPLAWMRAHVDSQPRTLRRALPSAPSTLGGLIGKMLDKVVVQRPTAEQVEAQLRALGGQLTSRTIPGHAGLHGMLIPALRVGAIVFLVSASATGTWWTLRARTTIGLRPAREAALTIAQIQDGTAATRAPRDMVFIPGQRFTMGSSHDEMEAAFTACKKADSTCEREEMEREQPQRIVTVHSFYLDRQEVTNQQYSDWLNKPLRPLYVEYGRLVKHNATLLIDLEPPHSGIVRLGETYQPGPDSAARPVVQVTWYGARQFCISKGRDLPTEAQWELAARGLGVPGVVSQTPWPWGQDEPRCDGVAVARQDGGFCQGAGPSPAEVGHSPQDRTPHGALDLGGNVREWVLDRFLERYPDCGTCIDPLVRGELNNIDGPLGRVVRGGNWFQARTGARSAGRSRWLEDNVGIGLGFRCALVIMNPSSS